MGLDMYLTKRTYIGGNYDHRQIKGTIYITKAGEQIPISLDKVSYITEEAMYWRKSNQIHKWFVENVQGGVDNCEEYRVTVDQLKQLIKLCKQIDKDHSLAEKLLPTQEGFFFGGTAYDEYYFEDIKATIKGLSQVVKNCYDEDWDITFLYQSSW